MFGFFLWETSRAARYPGQHSTLVAAEVVIVQAVHLNDLDRALVERVFPLIAA